MQHLHTTQERNTSKYLDFPWRSDVRFRYVRFQQKYLQNDVPKYRYQFSFAFIFDLLLTLCYSMFTKISRSSGVLINDIFYHVSTLYWFFAILFGIFCFPFYFEIFVIHYVIPQEYRESRKNLQEFHHCIKNLKYYAEKH